MIEQVHRRKFLAQSMIGSALYAALLVSSAARADVSPLPAAVPPGTRLVIGDQNEYLQSMLAASGVKNRLIAKPQFANFLGGPEIQEAFRAGALDVAMVGSTPPIHAHAAGEAFPIVAALRTSGPAYRFALRPGLKAVSLGELKGKRIAFAEGTARQPFVLSALKKAGLSLRDVTLVPLKVADFPVAVRTGQVDAAPLNEPHFSRYLKDYASEKASSLPESAYADLPTSTLYLYASRKALGDPAKAAAIRELAAGWIDAVSWTKAHPDDWVHAYYIKRQGLRQADGQAILKADGELSFPSLRDIVHQQQELIDLIHDAGQLPRRLDASEEFDFRFDLPLSKQLAVSGSAK